MKNRSTRKNKTRNFRKTNRGGMRGKPASNARTFRTFKPSRASRETNRRGDREDVVDGRLWKQSWTDELEEIINPELLDLMNLDTISKKGEKYGLIYDIYSHAHNILKPKPDIDDKDKYKNTQMNKMLNKIQSFIDNYAQHYSGRKLLDEFYKNEHE